jgi:hypothetical protein
VSGLKNSSRPHHLALHRKDGAGLSRQGREGPDIGLDLGAGVLEEIGHRPGLRVDPHPPGLIGDVPPDPPLIRDGSALGCQPLADRAVGSGLYSFISPNGSHRPRAHPLSTGMKEGTQNDGDCELGKQWTQGTRRTQPAGCGVRRGTAGRRQRSVVGSQNRRDAAVRGSGWPVHVTQV